ncbi:MAG: DNA polymerase I [Alphaproteobacteria bacterium]|nr:DNA polymerase I [Alphaproteobacteria bacterium]
MCWRPARAGAIIISARAAEAAHPAPKLVLVDGSGFIFRAFHALPPMTRPDGTPVNAVFGFANMLMKLLADHAQGQGVDRLAVVFDAARETFRNRLYPDYKAHRPDPPPELVPQFALVREATRAFNIPALEAPDWEADDLIAAYAKAQVEAGGEVVIVSSDKDLMQLVGPGVSMLDPIKNRSIGEAEVVEKFGVPPAKVVDVQALAGDSVDNVPGVPGIGLKTAAQLITEYGDLETLLARAGEIKQPKRRESLLAHAEDARISRELVRLRADAPLPAPLDALGVRDADPAVLGEWLKGQGFRSIVARLAALAHEHDGAPHPPAVQPAAPAQTQDAPVAGARPASSAPAPANAAPDANRPFGPYETITTLEALQRYLARAAAQGVLAVDTETDSLDARHARLVGVSLALGPGDACYIPLRHVAPGGGAGTLAVDAPPVQLDLARAIAALKPVLEDEATLKLLLNAKYDLAVLAQAQNGAIRVGPVDDAMLISYCLEGGAHGHGMDELSVLHLGHQPISYDAVTGTGRGRITFDQVPLDRATAYAAEDADVTFRLWSALRPRLRAERVLSLYEHVERPLIGVLLAMEAAGVKVDAAELKRISQDFAQRLEKLEHEIHALAGTPFTIGSPKQLGEVLFETLKLEPPGGRRVRTKTGQYATDADVLEELASQHPLPARVLDWRQLAKLKSTYADALVNQIDPDTGRVHTSFAMAAASTGRLASSDPNLQNIPVRTEEGKRIRRAFVAERGHVLLSADYSQIELRLLAHVADIGALKEAFREGEDIHARTAAEVFGVPAKGMDPDTRRKAKAINFGIIYGISAYGLGAQLGIPANEARTYIEAYFRRYPGIRDYMERTKEEARLKGFVTTPFGRRCWLPGIADRNAARRAFSERAAINAPLQGGAADIIKRAMLRLPAALAEAGLGARMLLQVHDELLFEVPEAEAQATASLVRGVMEGAASLSVPLVVETGLGRNWAEAH